MRKIIDVKHLVGGRDDGRDIIPYFAGLAPLLAEYWIAAQPPGYGPLEIHFPSFTYDWVNGNLVMVAAFDGGNMVGFMVGYIRQSHMCRDKAGTIATAYIMPEYRGGNLAIRMGLKVRRAMIANGAKHIYMDKVTSQSPYTLETVKCMTVGA